MEEKAEEKAGRRRDHDRQGPQSLRAHGPEFELGMWAWNASICFGVKARETGAGRCPCFVV